MMFSFGEPTLKHLGLFGPDIKGTLNSDLVMFNLLSSYSGMKIKNSAPFRK